MAGNRGARLVLFHNCTRIDHDHGAVSPRRRLERGGSLPSTLMKVTKCFEHFKCSEFNGTGSERADRACYEGPGKYERWNTTYGFTIVNLPFLLRKTLNKGTNSRYLTVGRLVEYRELVPGVQLVSKQREERRI